MSVYKETDFRMPPPNERERQQVLILASPSFRYVQALPFL